MAHMGASSWAHQGDKKTPLGLECLCHLVYQNKIEHEVVVDCTKLICSRNCPHVCDTHLPLAACKDRAFSVSSLCSVGTGLNMTPQEILRNPVSLVK